MKILRNKFFARTLLLFLAINILVNTLYPTISYALTSGTTQPEIFGHQPVDSTDDVSLLTGQFNHSMDITSVPEYPMALGYSSGISMDQEASCFGLGFNSFPGAIGRNALGLPDDLAGKPISYDFTHKKNWEGSVTGSFDIKLLSLTSVVGIGASVSLTIGYDNYKGMFGALGLGLGVSAKLKSGTSKFLKNPKIGIGIDATYDSRYGAMESIGAGFSPYNIGKDGKYSVLGVGIGMSLRSPNTISAGVAAFSNPIASVDNGNYSGATGNGQMFLSSLTSVNSIASGFGVTLTVPLGSFSVSANYKQFEYGNDDMTKYGFGSMYLSGYDRNIREYQPDFTAETEDSYDDGQRNNPSYIQKDFFVANCQGLSGSMQFVNNDYGVLSRNYSRYQYRDVFLTVKTDRKEVFPWDKAKKAVYNREIDILKLLKKPKKPGENDFDNFLFIESDKTNSYKNFSGNPKLRFRGDMAGSLELSSNNYADFEPNKYETEQAPGAGDGFRFAFLGGEEQMPIYYARVSDQDAYKNGVPIQKSNQIEYSTDGDGLINSINVTKADGMLYTFGKPVMVKPTTSLTLSGKGTGAPHKSNGTYNSNSNGDNFNKLQTTENFSYPYAWLVTEIKGADYIDFDNVVGPSDGDLGYWVKFTYDEADAVKDYRWREPYVDMKQQISQLHNASNDIYSVSSGTKDVYYVSKIESATHICKYNYSNSRADTYEAPAFVSTPGLTQVNNERTKSNTTAFTQATAGIRGSRTLKRVESIVLYKKKPSGFQSNAISVQDGIYGKKVKATFFSYDYGACQKTLNSTSGKLRLTKVQHVAYNAAGVGASLPSTQFTYAATNPEYDPSQNDMWGNYSKLSRHESATGIYKYSPYPELSKTEADANASAFLLESIATPLGGTKTIKYEAGGYRTVQNKTALVARKILKLDSANASADVNKFWVDVSDMVDASGALYPDASNIILKDGVYFAELAYHQNSLTRNNNDLYLAKGTVKVNIKATSTTLVSGRYYLQIDVVENNPFNDLKQFLYGESNKIKALKGMASESQFDNMEQAGPIEAAKGIVASVRNYFFDSQSKFDNDYGSPGKSFYRHHSYLFTSVYKEKYTGHRVKSITLKDGFSSFSTDARQNTFTTNYFYDENGDGTGISTGVATIEPMGGASCAVDITKMRGIGFLPSPRIMYSKTTVENGYAKQLKKLLPADDKTEISREKGKTVYEFYTAKDKGLGFYDNYKDATIKSPQTANGRFYMFMVMTYLIIPLKFFKLKIPLPVPVTVSWNRKDYYHLHSYAYTDVSDQLGRPYKISELSSSTGKPVTTKEFIYYKKEEGVKVINGELNPGKDAFGYSNTQSLTKPGRIDQTWSESYFTKESDIKSILILMMANTYRHFSYTNMKYTYLPPVLKEVITTSAEGYISSTQFSVFDNLTGEPLETVNDDSYGNIKYGRSVPAYWVYPEMKKLNMLSSQAASYSYLNSTKDVNKNLLSVSVTEWSKDKFNYASTVIPSNVVTDATSKTYAYRVAEGTEIKSRYVNQAKMYRPYRSYLYKTNVADGTGTFTINKMFDFVDPSISSADLNWQNLSTITLYHPTGEVAEVKDILGKYAASYLGYNFSNNITKATNSLYAASVHDGAESNYKLDDGTTFVSDNTNVKLNLAQAVSKECTRFEDKLLNYTNVTPFVGSDILSICLPAAPDPNLTISKLKLQFANGITRFYNLKIDATNKVRVISNSGEEFTGFYLLNPQKLFNCGSGTYANNYQLIYDSKVITSITPLATVAGHYVTKLSDVLVGQCAVSDKPYKIPAANCMGEVHTGNYAYMLPSGKGSQFTVLASEFVNNLAEYKRKYTAMVWVHKNSPAQTKLIIQSGTIKSETVLDPAVATPFITAGNWRLLRVEIDLTAATVAADINAWVENNSAYGMAYYDDFRVQPSNAALQATVYDELFGRVKATLDAKNLATFYEYDDKGRLIHVKNEVENLGPVSTKAYRYTNQKTN